MVQEKKDLPGIDIFKFIAALLVVLIHTKPFVSNDELQYYSQCCFRIAVPFFFLTSSFFLFQNYYEGKIWKYVRRLFKIYVCWFLIEIYFTYRVFFVDTDGSLGKCIVIFVKGLLFNNSFFASWYLTASIQASIIVVFLIKWKIKGIYLFALICMALACSWSMYYGLFDNPTNPTKNMFYWCGVLFSFSNSFVVAIPYFFAGYLLAKYKSISEPIGGGKLLTALIAVLLIGLLEVISCYNIHRITDAFFSLLPLAVVLLLISLKVHIKSSMVFIYMRKCSILIYLLHCILIYILLNFFGYQYGLKLSILVITISIVLSIIIVKLSGYIPILKYLY